MIFSIFSCISLSVFALCTAAAISSNSFKLSTGGRGIACSSVADTATLPDRHLNIRSTVCEFKISVNAFWGRPISNVQYLHDFQPQLRPIYQ